jgi:hypothetical protein
MGVKPKSARLRIDSRTRPTEFNTPNSFIFPKAEEIAQAIWKRQRSTLSPGAIYYNTEWRDHSLPSRYWDDFVLDAHAVLTLLRGKNGMRGR